MTWADLREMHAAGMEIGSHGVNHCMLATLPRDRMAVEVEESRRVIERELASTAIALSYPVGGSDSYDAETIAVVRSAGYRIACSYIGGAASMDDADMFALPRISVERNMDKAWFQARLAVPGLFIHSPRKRVEWRAEQR